MAEKLPGRWEELSLPLRIAIAGLLVGVGAFLMGLAIRDDLWRSYQARYAEAQSTLSALQGTATQQAHELADARATAVHFTADLFVGEGTQPPEETLIPIYEAIAQGSGRYDVQGPIGHSICGELAANRWGAEPILYESGREIRLLDDRYVFAGNRLAVYVDEVDLACPGMVE